MDYEKIILELMGRIQVLEEEMTALREWKNQFPDYTAATEQKTFRITTGDIREYIMGLKDAAKKERKKKLVLRSGDIHKQLNLKSAMPAVCNAMRQAMNAGDIILHTTPSGNSSTIEIEYHL